MDSAFFQFSREFQGELSAQLEYKRNLQMWYIVSMDASSPNEDKAFADNALLAVREP